MIKVLDSSKLHGLVWLISQRNTARVQTKIERQWCLRISDRRNAVIEHQELEKRDGLACEH